MSNTKQAAILAAYSAAVAEHGQDIGPADLFAAIVAVVPDATIPEVIEALRVDAARAADEAKQLAAHQRRKFRMSTH